MGLKDTETFCPANRQAWRRWLQKNHQTKQSIWVIMHKKGSNKPVIAWSDAVDEALCFGWVDSTRRTIDEERFMQFFAKRKPVSTWSKINKDKVQVLIEQGLMKEAGLASIELAKQNGSWAILDTVEALKIPRDLSAAFKSYPGSKAYFTGLSKSVQKIMLQWIVLAKRPETRQKRIQEIASLAAQKLKPMQFR